MKTIEIDEITFRMDGTSRIKLLKKVLDPDTNEVLISSPHIVQVYANEDIETKMAMVNESLERDQKYPKVSNAQLKLSKDLEAVVKGK